jgi:hypothetical protein
MTGPVFFAAPGGKATAEAVLGIAFAFVAAECFLSVSLGAACSGGSSSGVKASFDGFRPGVAEDSASALSVKC